MGLLGTGELARVGALAFSAAIVTMAVALWRRRASLPPPRLELPSMREPLPSI